MSPQSSAMLLAEIAPRLRVTIPRVVHKVGAEDDEELIQDALVMAAKLLKSVDAAQKKVTAGNIAFYTILHMKSGRRSQNMSRIDVMAPATQLNKSSSVLSMEEEVGYDPELDEAITLGSTLEVRQDDPSMAGARNVDWATFLSSHDYRYGVIVMGLIEGLNLSETARMSGIGYWQLGQAKLKLAEELREFMGASAIDDSLRVPAWRANLMVDRERAACLADRRRG